MSPPRCAGALLAPCLLLLAACTSAPPPRPLDPEAVLRRVRSERAALPPGRALHLAEATAVMRRNNPAIREARAAYATAAAVARVPSPLPNPSLELGPLLLGGADVLSNPVWGLEAALGWTVLLGRTNVLHDQLHRVEREAAFAEAAAEERTQYLALRRELAQAALEKARWAARGELADAAEAAVDVGKRMAEAGQASSLDVHLLDLDARRAAADRIEAEEESEAARHAVAARVGVAAEGLAAADVAALPALPGAVPSLETLERALAKHHPDLAALRAAYLVAEKKLRLEVGSGIPSLDLGVGVEHEDGENRIGLPLGIEVPLFDRNQVEIARACAERDAMHDRYAAALHRRLAEVGTARARLLYRLSRLNALETQVRPASAATLDAARASLEAGSADALSYLEALRAERDVALDLLSARIAVYAAWADLEQAAGVPLLDFPEATNEAAPAEGFPPPADANDSEEVGG